MMNGLIVISTCGDGTCCCLPSRSTIVLISLISLMACFADKATNEVTPTSCVSSSVLEYLDSMRLVLTTLFQMANLLLLLASIVENATLVQVYVWYTLSFVVMGFVIAIVDFLLQVKMDGIGWSLISFVPDVVFLFVIYRCLPLVDTYRKHLNGESSIKN